MMTNQLGKSIHWETTQEEEEEEKDEEEKKEEEKEEKGVEEKGEERQFESGCHSRRLQRAGLQVQ